MNEELFGELVESVREGGTILQGEAARSKSCEVDGLTIKKIRATDDFSEADLASPQPLHPPLPTSHLRRPPYAADQLHLLEESRKFSSCHRSARAGEMS
jgi:hypothetical protein